MNNTDIELGLKIIINSYITNIISEDMKNLEQEKILGEVGLVLNEKEKY